MGKYKTILLVTLTVYTAYVSFTIFSDADIPLVPEKFWGPKSKSLQKDDVSIRPFKINVDEKVLSDLKSRLKLELSSEGNRITEPLEGVGFDYGFNTKFLRKVGQHWLEKYEWRQRENLLNKYPHFKTQISGIDIHFQHVKSTNNQKYKKTRPLLLMHGWPGSFVEFQKIIPLLTDPEEPDVNFELVIPSLPGFGFSEPSHQTGFGSVETAQLFLKLMKRLGYTKFYAQGGDWGSVIATHMAALYHRNVMGIHLNMCFSSHPRVYLRRLIASIFPPLFMDSNEVAKYFPLSKAFGELVRETGYMHFQATKPDTLGVGLSNSPTGLAAYILEKFSTWTNMAWIQKDDGGLLPHFNIDELLDNLMIYWVTNSITTSFRLYSEHFSVKQREHGMDRVPTYVPTGCLSLQHDPFGMPEFILGDKYPQIIQFTKNQQGGHFAAFEVPKIFAKDVLSFFSHIENSGLALFDKKL